MALVLSRHHCRKILSQQRWPPHEMVSGNSRIFTRQGHISQVSTTSVIEWLNDCQGKAMIRLIYLFIVKCARQSKPSETQSIFLYWRFHPRNIHFCTQKLESMLLTEKIRCPRNLPQKNLLLQAKEQGSMYAIFLLVWQSMGPSSIGVSSLSHQPKLRNSGKEQAGLEEWPKSG